MQAQQAELPIVAKAKVPEEKIPCPCGAMTGADRKDGKTSVSKLAFLSPFSHLSCSTTSWSIHVNHSSSVDIWKYSLC